MASNINGESKNAKFLYNMSSLLRFKNSNHKKDQLKSENDLTDSFENRKKRGGTVKCRPQQSEGNNNLILNLI